MQPYLPEYIKKKNRRLVYDLLRQAGAPCSRAAIARETQISFPTVIKAVDTLLELGLIAELPDMEKQEGGGRRGHLLEFRPGGRLSLGVHIEGSSATIGLVDLAGTVVEKSAVQVPETSGADRAIMRLAFEEARKLAMSVPAQTLLGVGIGFPAQVDAEKNTICHMSVLDILQETPFLDAFPEWQGIGMPLVLENDVNAACIGDLTHRALGSMLYLTLGTGFGGAVMLEGRLWRGAHNKTGEVGNLLVRPGALPLPEAPPEDRLESLIGLAGLERRFGTDLRREIPADKKEEIALYISKILAVMLYNFANTMDVEACVLGGIIPRTLGDVLYEKLAALLAPAESLKILPPAVQDAGVVGAAGLIQEKMIDQLLK